ncbi:MAG: hypothetical protein ACTHKE_03475 [Sphingomicrobium sp.]
MREMIALWVGTAVAAVIYLAMCSLLDVNQVHYESCSVVRCV